MQYEITTTKQANIESSGSLTRLLEWLKTHEMNDFRACAAHLSVHNAVRGNLVMYSAETSNHFLWPEASPKNFFTESTSAYQRPDPGTVADEVFNVASPKVVAKAVGLLQALDAKRTSCDSWPR